MTLDWWTLGLQTLNVLVLLWLLSRFLFKPIAAIILERQQAANQLLDEAAAAKDDARQVREAADQARAEADRQRAAALQAAERDADQARRQRLKEAEAEIDHLHHQAQESLRAERQALQSDIETRAGELALAIAGKLMQRLPDGARIEGFIEGLVEGLASLPAETRRSLNQPNASWRLTVPRPLTDNEHRVLNAALQQAVGGATLPEVIVDPGLIAGLELETEHSVVRNSLRADLARLKTEMSLHDIEQS
ncbi:F0F1 ATP synthase subunit delta [Halomonas sp. HP20-15]|uniref:F0F1 ATP synthase subunit delta n=1 Tax=Halomonas sp. HP20-15 TaxID=3085901 RepID=UPI0029812059|nr:F0F1 ATP synthase subunit delta [Halomonas sp. HP20-15]MDW5377919.1 F0F1 ATP synthase subunit delta [Halomonas sp. HP20-15]